MNEGLLEIGRGHDFMTWALMFITFLTFLGISVTACVAFLVRGDGIESRREILESRERGERLFKEMREDSKRMQFYLFSKFGPAELK